MDYLTFDCSLDYNVNPEQICCEECSGRVACLDLQKDGLGTEPRDHCVRCGDYWFDKGAICEECERNFCPSFWQNFFVFPDDDCEDETCEYFGMEGICPECFAKHPEWWCNCKNCRTSKTKWNV